MLHIYESPQSSVRMSGSDVCI